MANRKRLTELGLGLLALACVSCSYHNANVNFRQLENANVYIAVEPTLSENARSFGEVTATKRFLYGWPCSVAAQSAVKSLKKRAIDRGGNLLKDVEFKGRDRWTTNPQCRRNLNYAWLILPMFLPVPQSVKLRGEAVYDPALSPVAGE
jgi:hypothetical protein